jgi:hypothetical protein
MRTSLRRALRRTFTGTLLPGGLLSVVLLAAVAKAALVTGLLYMLFPELAALSYDVFTRPAGAWARSPLLLAATPAMTAAMGTALTQAMAYNVWSVTLTIASAIAIVRVMRSPVVPAVSAAFLPLVFGIASWWYPISITAVMSVLGVASALYGWISGARDVGRTPPPDVPAQADQMEPAPRLKLWPFAFAAFLLLMYGLASVTGLRLILFPPLVVIAFEMFSRVHRGPWTKRPFAMPLVCTIAAAIGLAALATFGAGPLSVAFSLLASIAMLRVMRLHFPPALTIGLLPQIMPHADRSFVLAVALGSTALASAFLLARPVLLNQLGATSQPTSL